MRFQYIVTTTLFIMTAALIGCDDHGNSSLSGNLIAQGALQQNAIVINPATSEQCPGGGSVMTLYIDKNSNGLLDSTETVLTTQKLCNGVNGTNGTNGTDGFSTLFAMTRVTTGIEACASGSGLEVSFGLDSDHSGQLESSEISQTQVLCDGTNGLAGSNGTNAVFAVVGAPAQICPSGGSTILMALDTLGLGVYSALDSHQESVTICNGTNGTDGINGTNGSNGTNAVLPGYTPVAPIFPCGNTVAYKEVLLQLANGQVLASFSDNENGKDTRLAFIPDGSYIDTDDTNCHFSLSTSADGATRSISWNGHVQQSWPITNN